MYVLIVLVWILLFCMLRTCPNHPFVLRLFGSMAQPFDGAPAADPGLTQQQLSMFPVFKLPQPEGSPDHLLPEDQECAICLCPYEAEQPIKRMFCRHHYHSTCIDQWLATKVTCPLCNSNVLTHVNAPSAPVSPAHASLQLPARGAGSPPPADVRIQLPQQTHRTSFDDLPPHLDEYFDGKLRPHPAPSPPPL